MSNILILRADQLPVATHPDWIIEGIVPALGATEIYGPAGTGKSHIVGSILRAAAMRARKWYSWDMNLQSARRMIWWITDELSDPEGASRMISRVGGCDTENMRIVLASGMAIASLGVQAVNVGDYYYDDYRLLLTPYGQKLFEIIKESGPALIVIDSATALVRGITAPSQESAITVSAGLDRLARTLGCPVIITAHVSQESGTWPMHRRLSYAARTGTAGVAAGYSTMIGVTRWQPGEYPDVAAKLRVNPEKQAIICMSVSKQRDAAEIYDCQHPIVLARHPATGHIELVCDRAELPVRSKRAGGSKKGGELPPVAKLPAPDSAAPDWIRAAYGDRHA